MEMNMMVCGLKIWEMDLVSINIKMGIFIRGIGKMMKSKVLGNIILLMVIFIKGILSKVKSKDKEFIHLLMGRFMKVYLKMIV